MFAEKSNKRNMNIIQKKSIFSCSFEFCQSRQSRQTRIKSLRQRDFKDTVMLAKKQFRKNLNVIQKKICFSFFSMFSQIKIINYFKFVDQSIKSIKFNIFINCLNSTSRICFSINQDARTSHIAFETNFTSLIRSKIKNRVSIDSSESRYLVAADVDHINKDIRVETSLTNAKRYNSIKSSYNSIKSSIKLFKSLKSSKKLKSSIFSSRFNSTSRVCFSVNQVARFIESSIDFSITSMNLIASVALIALAVSTKSFYSMKFLIASESISTILKFSHHSITMMNASIVYSFTSSSTSSRSSIASHQKSHTSKTYMTMKKLFEMFAEKTRRKSRSIIQKKSTSSCSSESRQTRIKSLRQRDSKDTAMLAKRQFRRSLNAIRKRMRSSLSSMLDQIKITSYFKSADQSFKSFKFSAFETPQYQQTATDEAPNQRRSKSFEMQSSCTSQQGYISAADVYHTNKDIRVETPLTNARKYNSVKSSIKRFKSPKSAVSLSSTSRLCSPANQIAGTPQHQHIATDGAPSLETQQKAQI